LVKLGEPRKEEPIIGDANSKHERLVHALRCPVHVADPGRDRGDTDDSAVSPLSRRISARIFPADGRRAGREENR
jgi:hypothetical protein